MNQTSAGKQGCRYNLHMAMNEDKKWEMLQQALLAGARGDEPRAVVSKRTLFGIRSSVEEQMDAIAAQIEAELKAKNTTKETSE